MDLKPATAKRRLGAAPRPRLATVLALAGWCSFACYLFLQALAGPALIWNDSLVYLRIASHSLGSSSLWAGPKPVAIPLLVKAAGSSDAFLALQAAVASLCWGSLAWVVGRLVTPGWRRVLAIWLVLAFATAFPLVLWNRSVLSESTSLSLLALLFAACIWTAHRWTWPSIAATAVVALGYSAVRDAQIWTVALLGAAIGVGALFAVKKNRGQSIRMGALAACLFAVTALTGAAAISSHRTTQDVADVYYVRVFPYTDRVAWFAGHGMPERQQIDKLAASTRAPLGEAKVVAVPGSGTAFAPLRRWMSTRGTTAYVLWILTHPRYVITEPLLRPERSFNSSGGNVFNYAPRTNPYGSPLTVVLWPPALWVLLLVAEAVVLGVLSEGWRLKECRMVIILTIVSGLSTLIAWHGDGQEVARHTIEGLAGFRLGLWILVIVWFDRFLTLSPRDSSSAHQDERPVTPSEHNPPPADRPSAALRGG